MRLWSLHPKYLDSKGLVALWREGLLAQNVLLGNTKGYKHHPQLIRFQECTDPIAAIGSYLFCVQQEATHRKYNFDLSKIKRPDFTKQIAVNDKQLEFEFAHLKRKLEQRDLQKLLEINSIIIPQPHPLFVVIQGDIAPWERF